MSGSDCAEFYSTSLIEFSSEYGLTSYYCASNIVGPYNIYPSYGDNTDACVFRTYGKWWKQCPMGLAKHHFKDDYLNTADHYIQVAFEHAIRIRKVDVFETYNPGAIVRIWAAVYNKADPEEPLEWIVLWRAENGPTVEPPESRIFSPPLNMAETPPAVYVRLDLNCSLCTYYTELDAIRVTGVKDTNYSPKPKKAIQSVYSLMRMMENVNLGAGEWNEREESQLSPLESLHESILYPIFSKLLLPDLGRLARTSRSLQAAVYDYLSMSRGELSLRYCWPQVGDAQLAVLRQRFSRTTIHHLDLSWCGNQESNGLHQITSVGFRAFLEGSHVGWSLTTLHVANCAWLGDECLLSIIHNCPELRELDLSSCRMVQSSALSQLGHLSHLQWLSLYRTRVTTEALVDIVQACSHLAHLNVGSCTALTSFDVVLRRWSEARSPLVELRSLDLWHAQISREGAEILSQHCCNLEELDLGWCGGTFEAELLSLIAGCKKLKKLFLTAKRFVTDNHLLGVGDSLSELEQLDVLGTHVTQLGVEHVLHHCHKLKMFDLSFCNDLDEAVVVDLRERFPNCAILRSFT